MEVDPPEFEEGPSATREPTPAPPAIELPPPTPPPVVLTRTGRQLRVPKALQDFIPSSTNGLSTHIPRPVRKPKDIPLPRSPTPSDHPTPSPEPEIPAPVEYAT